MWNLNRRKVVADPKSFGFDVNNNVISSCGTYLALFDNFDQTITFQDLTTLNISKDSSISIPYQDLGSPKVNLFPISFNCLCFLTSSNYLYLGSHSGAVLKVANPFVNKQPEMNKAESVTLNAKAVKFLCKGVGEKHILAVSRSEKKSSKPELHILNCLSMSVEHSMTCHDVNGEVTAVCFGNADPNHIQVFLGTGSCKVYVLNLTKNKFSNSYISQVTDILTDHKSPISLLSLSVNQRLLFSGSLGQTKRLWEIVVRTIRITIDCFT